MVAAAFVPDAAEAPTNPLDVISGAISRGFTTVLHDIDAMRREVVSTNDKFLKAADRVAARMEEASKVMSHSLGSPSADTGPVAARKAERAKGMVAAAREQQSAIDAGWRSPTMDAMRLAPPNMHIGGGAEAYQAARYSSGGSVSGLRGMVARGIQNRADSYAERQGIMIDGEGEMYHTPPNGVHFDPISGSWRHPGGRFAAKHEYEPYRVVQHPGYELLKNGGWRHTESGRFASAEEVRAASTGVQEMDRFARRAQIAGGLKDTAQAWASGAPIGRALLNTLPISMAAKLGAAGAVAYGTRQMIERAQALGREAREYRNVYGGSNIEGLSESLSRKANRFAASLNPFGPGAGEYDQLYGSAMNLGLRGGGRSSYINQAMRIMSGSGASTSQASSILDIAYKSGQSLYGLSEVLKDLSKSARDAGVNGKIAKDQFIEAYQAVSRSFAFYGSDTAKTAAAGITQANINLGIQGQTSPVGYGGLNDLSHLTVLARLQGVTPDQYLASGGNPIEGNTNLAMSMIERTLRSAKGESFGQFVTRFVASTPGFSFSDPTSREALVHAFLSENFNGGYGTTYISQILDFAKIDYSGDYATAILAAASFFAKTGAAAEGKKSSELQQKRLAATGAQAPSTKKQEITVTNDKGERVTKTVRTSAEAALRALKTAPGETGLKKAAVEALSAWPVAKQFFDRALKGEFGSYWDLRFLVMTSSGQKIVDIWDLLKFYPDQVQAGTVTVAEGDKSVLGRNIADIMSFSTSDQTITGLAPGQAAQSAGKGGPGQDMSKWVTKNPDSPLSQGQVTSTSTVNLGSHNGMDVTLTVKASVDQKATPTLSAGQDMGG